MEDMFEFYRSKTFNDNSESLMHKLLDFLSASKADYSTGEVVGALAGLLAIYFAAMPESMNDLARGSYLVFVLERIAALSNSTELQGIMAPSNLSDVN